MVPTDSLRDLPDDLRRGLIGITCTSAVSFVASTTLFLYITYRLLLWRWARRQARCHSQRNNASNESNVSPVVDLSLGLAQHQFEQIKAREWTGKNQAGSEEETAQAGACGTCDACLASDPNNTGGQEPKEPTTNPSLILIYMLIHADMQQSLGLLLSAQWLRLDGIFVPTSTCFAQGLLLTSGKLGVSLFVALLAANTYLSIMRGYRMSRRVLWTVVGSAWFAIAFLTFAGVVYTRNGAGYGGYYVRAGAWCWVNPEYENNRLWLEYFWIFFLMAVTLCIHALMFLSPRYRLPTTASAHLQRLDHEPPRPSGHHPAFHIYPLLYFACITPLAVGRMRSMSGDEPSAEFYCIAGTVLGCYGWLNVMLWSTTILFSSARKIADTGLDQFTFMRTPHARRFGNIVWVQGASWTAEEAPPAHHRHWWGWPRGRAAGFNSSKAGGGEPALGYVYYPSGHSTESSVSQEHLRRAPSMGENCIHMDVLTSVRVEADRVTGGSGDTSISSQSRIADDPVLGRR